MGGVLEKVIRRRRVVARMAFALAACSLLLWVISYWCTLYIRLGTTTHFYSKLEAGQFQVGVYQRTWFGRTETLSTFAEFYAGPSRSGAYWSPPIAGIVINALAIGFAWSDRGFFGLTQGWPTMKGQDKWSGFRVHLSCFHFALIFAWIGWRTLRKKRHIPGFEVEVQRGDPAKLTQR